MSMYVLFTFSQLNKIILKKDLVFCITNALMKPGIYFPTKLCRSIIIFRS